MCELGALPLIISYIKIPKLHMSAFVSYEEACATSGAIQ